MTELLQLRQELRDGAPIAIGALAGTLHVGQPTWELPRGTVSGSPEKIAEDLAEFTALGCSISSSASRRGRSMSSATRWPPSGNRSVLSSIPESLPPGS